MQAVVVLVALVVVVIGGCAQAVVSEPDTPADEALCDRAAYLITTPAGEQLSLEELDELARACDWCPAGGEAACIGSTLVEGSQAEFEARGRRLAVTFYRGDADYVMKRLQDLGARLACSDEATLRDAQACWEAGGAACLGCYHADFPPGTCVGDARGPFADLFNFEHTNSWLPPAADPCSCDRPRCE